MKKLIIYYTYTGNARTVAQDIAKKETADLLEIKDQKKRNVFSAYVLGSFNAMKQKKVKIEKIEKDINLYDKLIIIMPIWASFPAPCINNIIEILKPGKEIDLIMISKSGNSSSGKDKVISKIESMGCKVINYTDIKL